MAYDARIQETCGCGASLDVEGSTGIAERQAQDWRVNHQHVTLDEGLIRENERLRAEITALRETLSTVRP